MNGHSRGQRSIHFLRSSSNLDRIITGLGCHTADAAGRADPQTSGQFATSDRVQNRLFYCIVVVHSTPSARHHNNLAIHTAVHCNAYVRLFTSPDFSFLFAGVGQLRNVSEISRLSLVSCRNMITRTCSPMDLPSALRRLIKPM